MCAALLSSAASGGPPASSPQPPIIPRPREIEVTGDAQRFTSSTHILAQPGNAEVRAVADGLAEALAAQTGRRLPLAEPPPGVATLPGDPILLSISGADPTLGQEGYALTVTSAGTSLLAPTPCGLARGVQTIRQLLVRTADDTWQLPAVRVQDAPRYRWRGLLLDCGRHFMTKDFIKRYIDLLAYHKMNVFHWHLTEDQGWRIEIKKYPKLTAVGAWRGEGDARYGGFYTQEDVKEIVAYARSRYVTIVPEIEMPGHSMAALASYPELSCTGGPFDVGARWGIYDDVYCAGNDKTFEFLENVLTELLELFPSEWIHIGGDECPKTRWKACPKCQARIRTEGLKDEKELQSYFIRRMERFLDGKGRRLIGWDEILEGGLAPNATVQAWRSMKAAVAAAEHGHDVVTSPTSHCYVNFPQGRDPTMPDWMGFIDLEKIYSFEPVPADLAADPARHILGSEITMWTERAPESRVDAQVFPRLCAFAEVTWSPGPARNLADFAARLKAHYARLEALGVRYYVPPPCPRSPDTAFVDTLELAFEPPFGGGEIRYTLDGTEPTPTAPRYERPLRFRETTTVKARTYLPTRNTSDVTELRIKKLAPHPPVTVVNSTPGLQYAYYEGQWQQLPDFDRLAPAAAGVAPSIGLDPRKREANFALRFRGYIHVPADGVYTFHLTSDDGSQLYIGDELVVDHNGLHAAGERSGKVLLHAGTHPLTLAYFQAGGDMRLDVGFEGPGLARQPIPPNVLSHMRNDE